MNYFFQVRKIFLGKTRYSGSQFSEEDVFFGEIGGEKFLAEDAFFGGVSFSWESFFLGGDVFFRRDTFFLGKTLFSGKATAAAAPIILIHREVYTFCLFIFQFWKVNKSFLYSF